MPLRSTEETISKLSNSFMKTLIHLFFMLFMSMTALAQTGESVYDQSADGTVTQRNAETGLIEFTYREQVDGSIYIYDPEGVLIGAYIRNEDGELKFYPF
jgi:hypothetical protein